MKTTSRAPSTWWSKGVVVFLLLLGIVALRDVAQLKGDLPWKVAYDLPEFYCAGNVLDSGHDPYRYEPMRTCEHGIVTSPSFRANRAMAMPAPQPPYDFPALMALATFSYPVARALWSLGILAALALASFALWRLGMPLGAVVAALILSAGFEEMDAGQVVPFAFVALTVCGWMLAGRRDALAGVFAAATAIEPHLGTPVILATLLFVPRARASAIAMLALLAITAWLAVGPNASIVYLTQVLPAQAGAELVFPLQFSLSYALHFFGASNPVALGAGFASFAVLTVAGLAMAPRLSVRLGRRELLVFFPAATAVMGGVFVHVVEMCFAIPAALTFALYAPGWWRTLAILATAVLAVPWILVAGIKKLWLASVFVVTATAYFLRAGVWTTMAMVFAFAGGIYWLELHPPQLPHPAPLAVGAFAPNSLLQIEWHDVIAGFDTHQPLWLLSKLPVWCALATVFAIGIRIAYGRTVQSQPLP
jgi:hypothetical protein